MGYFLWLNDRIAMTNVANAMANINASNTDMASPPSEEECANHP